jgi:hypothetical protein
MNTVFHSPDKKNLFLVKLSFIVIFIGVLALVKAFKPRIMIIHSLAEKDKWTQEFNAGFSRSFSNNNYASITYQYLDANSNLSEIYKLKIGVLARATIDRLNPHLLILSDPISQELIGKNYVNNPDMDVILCGLNGSNQEHNYEEARNTASVFSHVPTQAIKELIPLLVPHKHPTDQIKIILLGDNSSLAKILKEAFIKTDWTPYNLIDLVTVNTFEDWKETILSLEGKVDLLIISDYKNIYTDDSLMNLKDPQEIISWTLNNITLPAIGLVDSFVQDSGDLALTASPLGQGETTAKLAHRLLLRKEKVNSIPPLHNRDYLIYLNTQIKNPNISRLPSVYHTFAQAMGNAEKKE